jgi:hypothetical protein
MGVDLRCMLFQPLTVQENKIGMRFAVEY